MTMNNDYITGLGSLALASRIRRVLIKLNQDGERIYRDLELEFRPKWFPVLHLLSDRSPMALTEIANLLDLAHPSVIETIRELTNAKLVISKQSATDHRCRELSLSAKGKRLFEKLQPIWDAFRDAGQEVIDESGGVFLEVLGNLEQVMDKRSLYDRIMMRVKETF